MDCILLDALRHAGLERVIEDDALRERRAGILRKIPIAKIDAMSRLEPVVPDKAKDFLSHLLARLRRRIETHLLEQDVYFSKCVCLRSCSAMRRKPDAA